MACAHLLGTRSGPLVAVLLMMAGPAAAQAPSDSAEVAAVLDALHEAASEADGARYFDLFAPGAVFIGTDATERWTIDAFRAYAEPYFSAGRGWTYVPTERHIDVAPGGETAWFDELLDNENYGLCRGTGVLVRHDGAWKIAQYHLTIPVPNALARQIVDLIRATNDE